MNLSAQFKEFLLSQDSPASKVTVKNYTSDVNRFIKWFEKTLGREFDPTDINTSLIESFKNDSFASYSASSVERCLSSLRKFFHFLKLEGQIVHSPFEQQTASAEALAKEDPWRLRDFKNHLYVFNASHLTIKNYIIDVKQFLNWAQEVLKNDSWDLLEDNQFSKINADLIEEYKQRLLNVSHLSPVSVNRKLSSLRRYISWANEEGLLRAEVSNVSQVSNVSRGERISFPSDTPDTSPTLQTRAYSSFPPLRLLQKTKKGLVETFDSLLIYPISDLLDKSEHILWSIKGRPVFKEGLRKEFKIPSFKTLEPKIISNVPKSFYAPALISTKNFPLHKKIWHHARNTRPNWYKKYHSYAFVSYLHFSILMLFISIMGYVVFDYFKPEKQTPTLAALPSAPSRILSFQGRLTDASDNPITTQTTLRMGIYNSLTASGSALLWQEVVSPTPDQDGIFNVILGKNTSIPQSLFAENSALWLGVTVGKTSELTPRQQIATVAFAVNAETLQGLPPITNSSKTANVVLALNSSGNLSIGGSASPTFQATGGTFTLSGKALALSTTASSNGNIVLSPDGTGTVDLQKPLQNTSNNNSLVAGAVEVDDLFAILGNSSVQAVLSIRQNGNGDLIIASTSGATKFRIDNGGNLSASGTINGLSVSSGTITSGTWNASAISSTYGGTGLNTSASTGVPFISSGTWSVDPNYLFANHGGTGQTSYSTGDILYASSSSALARLGVGTATQCLVGGTTPSWANCNSATTADFFWDQTSGVLYPNNSTVDFLIGGQSSASAKFAILNVNSGTPTASISANSGNNATYLTGSGSLQTVRNNTLTIGGDTTGNITLSPLNGGAGSLLTLNTVNQTWSGTTTVTASSLATITSAATLGMVSTTTLNLGSNVAINSAATALNLQADGAIDVNIAGGSGTTGCTISNSTGNLTCSGNISGASTGIQGFWQRASGALAPTNITDDLLLGATSTASAKFAFLNVAGGTPIASISANSANNATYLSGNGSLQTVLNNTLTLGGNTTGNIVLSPNNSAAGGKVLPGADNLVSLGSSPSARFKDIFLGSGSVHIQCTTGDGCGAGGLDYALGVNTSTGTFSIGVNGTTATGNPLVNIMQGGNVGIGTTTPTAALEIQNTTEPQILISNAGGYSGGRAYANGNYAGGWSGSIDNGTNVWFMGARKDAFGGSSGTERFNILRGTTNIMAIDTSGNVGIGTTAPSQKLDVTGRVTIAPSGTTPDNAYNGNLVITKPTASGQYINIIRSGVYPWSIGTVYNSNTFAIGTGQATDSSFTSPQFVMDTSGNVGIGTTAPSTSGKLQISGGDNSMALFGPNTTWASYLWVGSGVSHVGASTAQVISTNGNLHLDAGTSNDMYLNYYSAGAGVGRPIHMYGAIDTNSTMSVAGSLAANGGITVDGNTVIDDGAAWHRTYGSSGWYNGTYCGGWYMQDATYIRSYCTKTVYIDTSMYSTIMYDANDSGYAVDPNGTSVFNTMRIEGAGNNPANSSMCFTSTAGSRYPSWNSGGCGTSSLRYKHDINNLDYGLDQIMQLRPVSFIYNDDQDASGSGTRTLRRIGFIAEEVQNVVPEVVVTDSQGLPVSIEYQNLTALNTRGIQQQQLQIMDSRDRIATIEAELSINNAGDLTLVPTVDANFEVQREGRSIDRIGAFSDLVVVRIKAGYLETGRITTETLLAASANFGDVTTNSLAVATENFSIAGQGIRDYIYSIVDERLASQPEPMQGEALQIATNIISPLSDHLDGKIAVKLNDNEGKSKLEVQNSSGSAVASIDSHGNATFSGQIRADSIEAEQTSLTSLTSQTATVSGDLRAKRVIADQIDLSEEALAKLIGEVNQTSTPSASYITNNYYSSSQSATSNPPLATSGYGLVASGSASFDNLLAKTATFEQGLMSFGPTSFFEASIAERLFVGSALSIADNAINVLGSNLQIQPLRQGGVSFVAGLVEIDREGNLKVEGNAYFAKDVEIKGKLAANIISPLPDQDLVIELGSANQESSQNARNSSFIIRNSSQSGVLSINSQGDLLASGSGTFNKLNLSFVEEALAVSDTEVIASSSAGTAEIKANRTELTLRNPLVTEKSLIYLSPKTSVQNQNVYLLRQVPGVSFTVGINQPVRVDTKFNFLIIN